MVRGFYTAGSGMLTASRILDTTAENLANSKTAGYKQDRVITESFAERLTVKIDSLAAETREELGPVSLGRTIDSIQTLFEPGVFSETKNPFDLAISGNGFFTVQAADGTLLYTRNGEFGLDAEGFVVNASGARLMGENGPINTGGRVFEVSEAGGVYVEGIHLDNLLIYNPVSTDNMVKHAEGFFFDMGDGQQNPFDGAVKQGWLESSNVDLMAQMMEMMKSQRSLQSCSQALKIIDDTLEKAVQLGKMV